MQTPTSPLRFGCMFSPRSPQEPLGIAASQPCRFLVVLNGEEQIRARDGSRRSLHPGLLAATFCEAIVVFAVSAKRADHFWTLMGLPVHCA